MDFLDPKAKRRHVIRLIIGYGLMAVLVTIATIILVFSAYGFDVDRKTGEVIQNGLVFVDSAPDGATIHFNEQEQRDKTNNRFALPAGTYNIRINKDGYREWKRSFTLDGGAVERFTYPLLVPSQLDQRIVRTVDTAPGFTTESPDRRWVIMSDGASLTNFIEYDLNSLTQELPKARPFSVAADLFTPAEGAHTLELVEWANDNKHFLVKHSFTGGYEFMVVSRDQPQTSVNINKFLGRSPTTVTLRDKKFDSWYLFTQQNGILEIADNKKTITPQLQDVTAYKTHDEQTILYAQPTTDGKSQRISLKQGKDTYVLKEVPNGVVQLEIARYDDKWYVVVAADAEQKAYIYQDPVAVLQRNDGTKITPISVLKSTAPITQVSFSKNTRFITLQSGQHFESYDAEYNRLYRFEQKAALDAGSKVEWMDGHRMLARSGSKVIMFDYDGENQQELIASLPGVPAMFDRDYTVLYGVSGATDASGKFNFSGYDLRLEGDK